MNTSGFQVCFLSFSRNISVQLAWEGLDVAGDIVAYCEYQEQLGVAGMQIQYNYATLYTKTMLRNAFPILVHILFTLR